MLDEDKKNVNKQGYGKKGRESARGMGGMIQDERGMCMEGGERCVFQKAYQS